MVQEGLAPNATHASISEVFSAYGTIQYVSLPRFPKGAIKGFAFIEFATPDQARAATSAFLPNVPVRRRCMSRISRRQDVDLGCVSVAAQTAWRGPKASIRLKCVTRHVWQVLDDGTARGHEAQVNALTAPAMALRVISKSAVVLSVIR